MRNFVSASVLGKPVSQDDFLSELSENPLVKLALFIGAISVAGYFTIMFVKELVRAF